MSSDYLTASQPEEVVNVKRVILASSVGTLFEWYDFYLYGSLATFFGGLFFPKGNETAGFLASLATFGAGFAVRPFGAIIFGRIGDVVGRKYTFLVTIVIMGLSTALIGVLPVYEKVGILAPILLVTLRLAQGLALGGEYGGAATYVAEHAPQGKRGFFTSWIQTTATIGFFLSLAVILGTRLQLGEQDFRSWGWRVPFLVSFILLGVSVYIRLKLKESPLFAQLKSRGSLSKNPIKESFANKTNLRYVILALFGATAGQGVIWYCGQFYALFFLQNTLKVDLVTSYTLIAIALALGTPLFIAFGSLSDAIGRKKLMLTGLFLASITLFPIFKGLSHYANPELESAVERNPIVLTYDPDGSEKMRASIASARESLTKKGYPFGHETLAGSPVVTMRLGNGAALAFSDSAWTTALKSAGYPAAANPEKINSFIVVMLLTLLMVYVCMIYGPIAAFLVELFPTRIRYTSMSLPYHLGNGWFGGFMPLIAASITVSTGNIYAGLWFPVGVALMTFVVCLVWVEETKDRSLLYDANDLDVPV
ncbi:MAG TPA: MFS transporter [Bacteroidota bacterium]|nr:MFS transporter [Bacteroidota bacterium]